MAVLGNVLGFGAFGMAARAWQLGVQKRPILQAPGSYLLSGAIFGGIGYWLVGVEERQNVLLAQKRKVGETFAGTFGLERPSSWVLSTQELESRRNAAQTL
ncbi:hypothetical protein FRC09_003286 [Ceratobasidium sp. 395]|nr:hypothetical protein FRC09_003286 [Ceratobasidium sp. 395]